MLVSAVNYFDLLMLVGKYQNKMSLVRDVCMYVDM